METCKECRGEGLIAQGESIKNICADCTGTGKVATVESTSEVSASAPATETVSEVSSSESFLGESGESGEAPVSEEVPVEVVVE